MDIREELNKKLVLEKPAQVPQFKTNKKKKNKNSGDNKKVKSYARNEHVSFIYALISLFLPKRVYCLLNKLIQIKTLF